MSRDTSPPSPLSEGRGGVKPPPTPPKGVEEPHPTSPKREECLCAHERIRAL